MKRNEMYVVFANTMGSLEKEIMNKVVVDLTGGIN